MMRTIVLILALLLSACSQEVDRTDKSGSKPRVSNEPKVARQSEKSAAKVATYKKANRSELGIAKVGFNPNDFEATSRYLETRMKELETLYPQNEFAANKLEEEIQQELDRRQNEAIHWKLKVDSVGVSEVSEYDNEEGEWKEKAQKVVYFGGDTRSIFLICRPKSDDLSSDINAFGNKLFIREHIPDAKAMKLRTGTPIHLKGEIKSIQFGVDTVAIYLGNARVVD